MPAIALFSRGLRRTALACTLLSALASWAQVLPGTGPVPWSGLNPAQQGVLSQIERDWHTISPPQQQKWIEIANRFPSLPADERSRAQQRMADWARLTPQERSRTRLNFQEARQLSPQERQQQWDAYRALPADQKRALAEQASRAPVVAAPAASKGSPSPSRTVKSSVVGSSPLSAAQPVGGTVVKRGSGATTNLVSKPASPPLHQQAGLPKVAAAPGFVDSATLLPQRGAQGAAVRTSAIAADDKTTPK